MDMFVWSFQENYFRKILIEKDAMEENNSFNPKVMIFIEM